MTTTVTDPQGNVTVYTAGGYPGPSSPWDNSFSYLFHEVSRAIYNSGSLLRTINTTYPLTGGSFPTGWGNLPSTVTTTFNDIAPVNPRQQQVNYLYGPFNNVIEKDESDLYVCSTGVCPPPSWLRKTFTTYFWTHDASFQTAHIVNKPYTVTVTDGAGNPLSQTQYGYDEFALGGTTGYKYHDDAAF